MKNQYGVEMDPVLREKAADKLREAIRNSALKRAELREEALIACILQAIECGDFYLLCKDDEAQAVYAPYADTMKLRKRVAELEGTLGLIANLVQKQTLRDESEA